MDFRRLFDLFPYQQARFPQRNALAIRIGQGWQTYSTDDCLAETDRVSAALLDLGLQPGDRMAIIAPLGSPRWNFLDLGMQQVGVIVVPVHAMVTKTELEFILRDSGVRYCAVADRPLYDFAASLKPTLPELREVFIMEDGGGDVPGWERLSAEPGENHRRAIAQRRDAIREDDLATIIYTSGSTGQPKGVMLSHRNIVSNIKAVISLIPVNWEKRVLSMLPLSHIFERMVVFTYIAVGAAVYYSQGRDDIGRDMHEIKPHYFTAVPRILERMHDHLLELAGQGSALHRRIWHWAIRLAKHFREGRRRMDLAYEGKRLVADFLVYRHWRRLLGGHVEGVAVGAAALRPELGRLFSAARIDIREGYGLTETAPVLSFNRFEPGGVRFGTVGLPIPGVEIRIDGAEENGDGEILARGPNVMVGYHNDAAATQQVMAPDGWFRTGDLGKFVDRRFLQITGRRKDLFKTSTGRYIAPEPLENTLRNSPYIEQCLVTGDDKPFVGALIIPHFPVLRQWCEENRVHWTAPPFMVLNPKVTELMNREISALNEELPAYRQVRCFTLLHEPWTPETGELTPTLKLRRDVLRQKFRKEINEMFAAGPAQRKSF